MFRRNCFDIMIVDDDADVVRISTVVLKNLKYAGAPLRIHTFLSKHDALEFLHSLSDPTSIAAIITDVVMESDTAGLELCSDVRSGLKNDVSQLIIRTGQPGRAPQRQILEAYEINGYLSKAELTHDALNNLVLGALRNYEWGLTSMLLYRFFNTLLPGFRSRTDLMRNLNRFVSHVLRDGDALSCDAGYAIDGATVAFGSYTDSARMEETMNRLRALEGRTLASPGDVYKIDQVSPTHYDVLFELASADQPLPRVSLVATVGAQPTESAITTWVRALYSLRRLVMIADLVDRKVGAT